MHTLGKKETEILMKLDTEGLTPAQVRLIKTIHALLANVVVAEEESEYFDTSAELLKKAAELIKHSNFALQHNQIAYGHQAVEYSMDTLNEAMDENDLKNLDN